MPLCDTIPRADGTARDGSPGIGNVSPALALAAFHFHRNIEGKRSAKEKVVEWNGKFYLFEDLPAPRLAQNVSHSRVEDIDEI